MYLKQYTVGRKTLENLSILIFEIILMFIMTNDWRERKKRERERENLARAKAMQRKASLDLK